MEQKPRLYCRANPSYGAGYQNRGGRPSEQNQFPNRNGGSWQRSDNSKTGNRNWQSNRSCPRSPQGQREYPSQNNSAPPLRLTVANHYSNQQQDNRQKSNFTPYGQKFPQHHNQAPPNVVRFTRTDDCVNKLTELCPLKC